MTLTGLQRTATLKVMSIDQLTAEAMALPLKERLMLADALYASAPIEEDEEFDPEFTRELMRRVEEMDSGKVQGIPHEEVMEEAWRIVNAVD